MWSQHSNEEKPRLLIFTDQWQSTQRYSQILRHLKIQLCFAASMQQAQRLLQRHVFFAYLIDLPSSILQTVCYKDIIYPPITSCDHYLTPSIMVNHADYGSAEERISYLAGATDHLSKPVDPVILLSKIMFFLHLYHNHQYLQQQTIYLKQQLAQPNTQKDDSSLMLQAINEAIIGVDELGHINFINPQAEKLLGRSVTKLQGQPILTYLRFNKESFYYHSWIETPIYLSCKQQQAITIDEEIECYNQHYYFPIQLSASPIIKLGQFQGIILALNNISARKKNEYQLEQMAYFDPLTKLANRRYFEKNLQKSIKVSEYNTKQFALLFIDLDLFKQVNDRFGHQVGDQLLIQVTYRIKECVQKQGLICRFGGDEFIILIHHYQTLAHITGLAKQLIHRITQAYFIIQQPIKIGSTIGISLFPEHATTADTLIHHADQAMYEAKAQGKNCYKIYSRHLAQVG